MNKKTIPALGLALLSLPVAAQTITPSNDVIDCGQVIYMEPVSVQFELINQGDASVSISDVQTSCGCITVNYPQGMISRNKPFVVTAEYDARQLGHFEKYIDVYTTGSDEPVMLTIKGVVVAERKGFDGDYAFAIGRMRTDREELVFDDVNRGERPVQEIHILNSSSETVTPVFMHLPSYLKADVSPSTLAPGQSAVARTA